ncbi:insulin-like growth factor binding protein [Anaeramoeba flamelloides]|uniref:Insulin-like growth factor binding protein n=1 Tax=Anaeramoeba flamelloides TaxID=1746091 RepID=A0ABQ8XM13_9EUKA|nr:insulin-like growth factor binding protein [Anaeramoeba flamelloides]
MDSLRYLTPNDPISFTERSNLVTVCIGSKFQVYLDSTTDQRSPSIASIGCNQEKFVITWQNEQDGNYEIFAQVFNSTDGSKIGIEFLVSAGTLPEQRIPSIASIGRGSSLDNTMQICEEENEKFVITWENYGQDGSGWGIFGQGFSSANHTKIGEQFQVNTYASASQRSPSIASIYGKDYSEDKFVIVWESYEQDNDDNGVFAKVFNSTNFSQIDNEFQVNTFVNENQQYPAITGIWSTKKDRSEEVGVENDKFVIIWQSYLQDSSGWGVFGQVFSSTNHTKIGEEFQVNTYTHNSQFLPRVTSMKEKFVVSWASYQQDDVCCLGVYFQMFNSTDSSVIGGESLANSATQYDQTYPDITSITDNDGDKFVIVWRSDHQNQSFKDIYLKIFDSDTGEALLEDDFLVTNYTLSNKDYPKITEIGGGEDENEESRFVITWQSQSTLRGEESEDGYEIFAQIFSSQSQCRCNKGFYKNTSILNEECKICPKGYYQDQEGQTDCKKCGKGTYQDEEGQTYCKKCPKGTYQNMEGKNFCIDCPYDSFQEDEGKNSCLECPAGEFTASTGSTSIDECFYCEKGTYWNRQLNKERRVGRKGQGQSQGRAEDEQNKCFRCMPGTYQDEEGQTQCKKCPMGTFNQNEGSYFEKDCLECPIGTYNEHESQSSCNLCPLGKYQNSKGQSVCIDCPKGSYTDKGGSTACKLCSSGTYQNENGKFQCKNCAFDTWQSNTGASECSFCPLFSETLSTKSKSIKECFCSLGYYGKPGEVCQKCPENGVCNKFNQYNPLPKPGYWSSKENPNYLIKCNIYESCPGYEIETCEHQLGYGGYQCSEFKTKDTVSKITKNELNSRNQKTVT